MEPIRATVVRSFLPRQLRLAAARDARQAGSAYVLTLLVLLVLTILGISLSLITQTEMLVGAQERTIQRIFYTADSGLALATSRLLINNDRRPQTSLINESRTLQGGLVVDLQDQIEIAPVFPIKDAPCNLCSINQDSSYFQIHHAVTTIATRTGQPSGGGDPIPLARKTVSVILDVQPMELSGDAFYVQDPSDLDKLKF